MDLMDVAAYLRSLDEPEMAREIETAANRLEAFADGLDRDCIATAVAAEREACARVCDAEADSMEQGAQRAIENGEHDEVSAIRSTAWKLSVAANRIRARSNAK